MKKFLISAALVAAIAAPAVAQEEYAPAQGDFSVELQFNPFSNNFETFKIDQIKGRYFFSDKNAIRFGIGFGIDNAKVTPDPDENSDEWSKAKKGNFSLDLGFEHHFFNYKRVNLYAGAGLGFAIQNTSATSQVKDGNNTYESKICNAWGTQKDDIENLDNRSYTEFNVKLFTGVDFYVYKGLFVGAELGIKFGFQNYPGVYTKGGYDDNDNWSNNKESDKVNKVSGFNLHTYAEPALRLGYTF